MVDEERLQVCRVCGGRQFRTQQILWPSLVEAWQLAPHEAEYINRQQGKYCTQCGANLRSMVLAQAILNHVGYEGCLTEFVASRTAKRLTVLEVNRAGNLTAVLAAMPGHVLREYPECDMMRLDVPGGSVDLVVHSDTLEHVEDPVRGLSECRRVLSPGGACCFTVPIVVDRLSRSRAGLPDCHHGAAEKTRSDLTVRTEFGYDVWKYVIAAGFSRCALEVLEYPAGIALTAR